MSEISRFQAEQQDAVSHPSHYTGGQIECKDAMKAAFGGANGLPAMAFYWWGNAFKYLWRWRYKAGVTDLQKCKQCIDFLMQEIEGKHGETDGGKWYAQGGFIDEQSAGNRE